MVSTVGDKKVTISTTLLDGTTLVGNQSFDIDLSTYSTLEEIRANLITQMTAWLIEAELTFDPNQIVDVALNSPLLGGADTSISLSVQTSTGAVGTQVSTARDAWVAVNGSVSTTATIGGNSAGDLVVEVAPTNSATAGDWVEKGRIGNSQNISLALALNSVQIVKGQMMAFVPKGYYVKVRSITGSGSPTYAVGSARKVLV